MSKVGRITQLTHECPDYNERKTGTRTGEQLDRFAERMRESNSSDEGYQHMLDLIARDVHRAFGGPPNIISGVDQICLFIQRWRP